ncbi:MAG: hypothetical protein H6933_10960 [Burkholderiaceae bacterium]|nr:hypothetical protein [Burkholderiaceae bacterium]
MSEPWSFEDGPAAADRIRREYAERLLALLPPLEDGAPRTSDLAHGYRRVVSFAVQAALRYQCVTDLRLFTVRAQLQREARALRAVCQAAQLYLVASAFNDLRTELPSYSDHDLVLLAEDRVEELVRDIE